MAVLQINASSLAINTQPLTINGSEPEAAPAPEVVKQNRGKGKKQQIYSQGPWA
jgi:hypothetical protein